MTQNKLSVILVIILAALYLGLFLWQYGLFYGAKPTFPQQLQQLDGYCKQHQWKQANQLLAQVEQRWNHGQGIIAIKYADQDYTFLRMALARLHSSVRSQNVKDATTEVNVCLLLFENITSVVPKP